MTVGSRSLEQSSKVICTATPCSQDNEQQGGRRLAQKWVRAMKGYIEEDEEMTWT